MFYSHQVVYRRYINALVNKGHHVVVITNWPEYDKGKTPTNLTEIDISADFHKIWIEKKAEIFSKSANDAFMLFHDTYNLINYVFIEQFKTDTIDKFLRDKTNKFDLVVLESLLRMATAFSDYYQIPAIKFSSQGAFFENYNTIGASTQPILYPLMFQNNIYNLSLWEEVSLLYQNLYYRKVLYDTKDIESEAIKTIFHNKASEVDILENNVHLLYINTHPMWETIRPVPITAIYTYGIHQAPSKELTSDLASFLNYSANGVIYVSFGTTVDISAYSKEIQIMLKAFSQLPYDFLFKWNEDELAGKSSNIKIVKWVPQADLLKHPKIKAFITQGGTQSTDEAIVAGVPLVGIPLAFDQWANTERYVHHGIGIQIHIDKLTEEQLINAINTVINDKSYRHNIEKIGATFFDHPQSPLLRTLWWTEYLLRHGGVSHLRSPSANITWMEYFEVELIFILLFILFIIFTTLTCTANRQQGFE
ncbi:UDP-glucosyltransferase 2-like [Galleria mellonella]|uniref:UDP-glucuronosyltransferase n=1 Tax=Galleria mellonella TaxID=7137 RepID=A0ABM3MN99_GALME|nr:UDP-glucosyltransferase 2-like [Galleria mellonella]